MDLIVIAAMNMSRYRLWIELLSFLLSGPSNPYRFVLFEVEFYSIGFVSYLLIISCVIATSAHRFAWYRLIERVLLATEVARLEYLAPFSKLC